MSNLLGIEVGSKQIRYLVFSKKGMKFLVSKKGAVPIQGAAPSAAIEVIFSLIAQEKISPQNCYVNFLRDDMISSQLILPVIPAKELEEVVQAEIEKIPSFSSEDFYFVFSHRDFETAKIKVIFSAVAKGLVDALFAEARRNKSALAGPQLAPLSLLPLAYQLQKGSDEALVILDSNITYVMVSRAKECRLLYTISLGKSNLFRDNKLESSEFLNWAEELRRTFKAYSLSYDVPEVRNCWLVWDADSSELEGRIESKLGLTVKNLEINLFPGFGALPGIELDPRDCIAAAPVIAALKKYKSEFSFKSMFREQLANESKKTLLTVFTAYSLCALMILGGVALFYSNERGRINKDLTRTRAAIAELESKTQALRDKRDAAKRSKELLVLQARFVRDLNRISWSRVFGEVAQELPRDVSFTSFRVSGTNDVTIQGEALAVASVAEMVRRIDNSSVLNQARFDFLKEAKRQDESVYFTFGILASVRKNDQ